MKILFTGFDPFGGENVNPSWEAVKLLPDSIGRAEIEKLLLPTVFGLAAETLAEKLEQCLPDAVICVGQAAGRAGVSIERVAVNLRDASIPDNAGNQPTDEPVCSGGPDAYFSTLPVKKMVQAMKNAGIPASLSLSAGSFVCNDVMYSLLRLTEDRGIPAGFIHVPALPSQAAAKGGTIPSMDMSTIVRALEIAAESLL